MELATYTFTVGNLHCEGCERAVYDLIKNLDPRISEVHVSHFDEQVSVVAPKEITKRMITRILDREGYDLISEGETDEAEDVEDVVENKSPHAPWTWASTKVHAWKRTKAHKKTCVKCRQEALESHGLTATVKDLFHLSSHDHDGHDTDVTMVDSDDSGDSPGETPVLLDSSFAPQEFTAVYTIGGMTCAACSTTIKTLVAETYPQYGECAVDLINGSAAMTVNDKPTALAIRDLINDIGYDCELVNLTPVRSSQAWRLTAAISGMTCAACTSTIKSQVEPLSFVKDTQVSLLTNSASFVIDSLESIPQLKEAIEDAGYDFQQVEVKPVEFATTKSTTRTVNLAVKGMYCEHCPDNVTSVLKSYGETVIVVNPISLKHPFIKFTYTPNPPGVTIRKILADLRTISTQFEVEIVHPLTLEQRSQRLRKEEQRSLLRRLLLTFLAAIPTFIIGIVAMDLAPKKTHLRMFFEEPMWVGNVSRATWALFFLATPIFFFADDLFHRKAIKEILMLYRVGTSWRRRIFRFGSMNLLMSLGTSVAYISSLILLGLASHAAPGSTDPISTYFDSVVFLTLFLLMGRYLDAYSKAQTTSAVSMLGGLRPDTVNLVELEGKQGSPAIVEDAFTNEVVEPKDSEISMDSEIDISEADANEKITLPITTSSQAQKVAIDLVEVGDYVKVLPGEFCSTDARIVAGSSTFDESALTGESRPVKREIGDVIFAGTVNTGTTSVVGLVTAVEEGSLLNSIVTVVREGQLHRAPIERVAEKVTGVFVPIVVLLAVLTWVIWLTLGLAGALPARYLDIPEGGWVVWSLQFAIAVFVVACPCGIGLAAPTALFVGSGLAAKYAILARGGGEAFQEGSRVNIVCFDKTGTLTEGGEPKVTDVSGGELVSDEDISYFVGLAGLLENESNHPLATAVRNYAAEIGGECTAEVRKVTEVTGKGLSGLTDISRNGEQIKRLIIGNERLMEDNDIEVEESQKGLLTKWQDAAKSVILLGCADESGPYKIKLMIGVADKIRDESKLVVEALKKQGIDCWMISGDNERTAQAVAAQVSITPDHVIAGVLPQEKADKVAWLQKTGNSKNKGGSSRAIVAMVGDGVNDAPSLTTADVGIAIGSGSDLALTSAHFVLVRSDLRALVHLFDISRAVFRRVKFNFGWAFVYNLIGIPVAAGVIYPFHNSRLDPVWASLAMAMSSLSVVTSSLLLKLYRPPRDLGV